MHASEIRINLNAKVKEAKELLTHYQKELDSAPEDFALKLRFNSFRRHVQDLENQLAAHETFERGWDFLNEQNLEEAKREFRQAISLMPSYLGFLNNQLTNNVSKDNLELIISFMKFLLEIDPNYEVIRENLIAAYIKCAIKKAKAGNLPYAINLLLIASTFVNSKEMAKTVSWNLATAYTEAGKKSTETGNLEEASIHMLTALFYVRNETTIYNTKLALEKLSLSYLEKHEFHKAIETFEHIEMMFGLESRLCNDFAITLACIGQTTEGIAILENLLQDNSNLSEDILSCAKDNLTIMRQHHKASLESGLRLSPRSTEIDLPMSILSYSLGNFLEFQPDIRAA